MPGPIFQDAHITLPPRSCKDDERLSTYNIYRALIWVVLILVYSFTGFFSMSLFLFSSYCVFALWLERMDHVGVEHYEHLRATNPILPNIVSEVWALRWVRHSTLPQPRTCCQDAADALPEHLPLVSKSQLIWDVRSKVVGTQGPI